MKNRCTFTKSNNETDRKMRALENIIGNYLAGKTEQELLEVLKDLDKSLLEALEDDKKRCDKFLGLAQKSDFLKESSKEVFSKITG